MSTPDNYRIMEMQRRNMSLWLALRDAPHPDGGAGGNVDSDAYDDWYAGKRATALAEADAANDAVLSTADSTAVDGLRERIEDILDEADRQANDGAVRSARIIAVDALAALLVPELRRAVATPDVLRELREQADALVPMLEKDASLYVTVAAAGGGRIDKACAHGIADAMRTSAELITRLAAVNAVPAVATPQCTCGNPATCYGEYEGIEGIDFGCDGCCGHGNEDGWCKPIAEYMGRAAVPSDALRAAFVEGARWMWNHGWQAVAASDGDDAIEVEAQRRYPAGTPLLGEARDALARLEARRGEDVEQWAERLGNDIVASAAGAPAPASAVFVDAVSDHDVKEWAIRYGLGTFPPIHYRAAVMTFNRLAGAPAVVRPAPREPAGWATPQTASFFANTDRSGNLITYVSRDDAEASARMHRRPCAHAEPVFVGYSPAHPDVLRHVESALSEFDNIRWDDVLARADAHPDAGDCLARYTQTYLRYVRLDLEQARAAAQILGTPAVQPDTLADPGFSPGYYSGAVQPDAPLPPACTCGHHADEHHFTDPGPCTRCSCARYTEAGGLLPDGAQPQQETP